MSKSQRDLATAMDEGASKFEVAFAMLAHDDLSDVSAAFGRDKAILTFRD